MRVHSVSATSNHESPVVRFAGGFILIEILMGLVLLAILLGPLVTELKTATDSAAVLATGRSAATRDAGSDDRSADSPSRAWEWGPRVVSATWQPGPALEVKARALTCSPPVVGVWVDGWFRGEESPNSDGLLRVKPARFAGCCGLELTLRARDQDGEWGPPWRSIVPDSYAGVPATAAVMTAVLARDLQTEICTVAHPPELANPRVEASKRGISVSLDALRTPFFVGSLLSGRNDICVDADEQSWSMEDGRALDLYF